VILATLAPSGNWKKEKKNTGPSALPCALLSLSLSWFQAQKTGQNIPSILALSSRG
jgi:hypothetical protein